MSHNPQHAVDYTVAPPGSIRAQTATFTNQSTGYVNQLMDATWQSFALPLVLSAVGKGFYATLGVTMCNDAGSGPNYRMQVAIFVDGNHHGELSAMFTPREPGFYETHFAGANVENINPTLPPTEHTFELKIWGMPGGIAAIQEANISVLAFT